MGTREFPFESNAICEGCGAKGAFDIYGDMVCGQCLEKLMPESEVEQEKA